MNPSTTSSHALTIILSFVMCVTTLPAQSSRLMAGDWPQILGPERDGRALDELPLVAWEKSAPQLLWRLPAHSGYAGAVISEGKVYLFDRDSDHERLTCVDLMSGSHKWQARWPATYASRMDPDSGPRAVPTIAGDKIICYGAAGDMVCIDRQDGKILWQRALRKEFAAEDGFFGAGGSPLVVDQVVIANIGAKKAGIVGVDLNTGKTLWQATDYDSSYASPVEVRVGGQRAALVPTRMRTVLLDPKSGKLYSEIPFEARGASVIAATPLSLGEDHYLLTASYNIGALLVRIRGTQLERVWKDSQLLASQYNSPVLLGNTVVGVHGREDAGEVVLRGMRRGLQQIAWEEPLPGPAHLIVAGEQLLYITVDGRLNLAKLTSERLSTISKFDLLESDRAAHPAAIFRALPALSQHVLVVRQSIDAAHSEFSAYRLP